MDKLTANCQSVRCSLWSPVIRRYNKFTAVNGSNYFQQTTSGDLFAVSFDLSRFYKTCHTRHKIEYKYIIQMKYDNICIMIIANNTANFSVVGQSKLFL